MPKKLKKKFNARVSMRIEAPCLDECSEFSEGFEDFLDELTTREVALRRQAEVWTACRDEEDRQTERILTEMSANLVHHQDALAEAQLNIRALSDELAVAREEVASLRGKLRFSEARRTGLTSDLKVRRTIASANEARLLEEIDALNRQLRILKNIKNTSLISCA